MQRKSFSSMQCPIARGLEHVGEWWSILILRDAFAGMTRFDEFQSSLGIAPNMLTRRLNALVEAGMLERHRYSEHPPRYDYRLTPKGRDLWPVVNAMRQWGDQYAAPHGAPVTLVHRSCGHVAQGVIVCSECGGSMNARTVQAVTREGRTRLRRKSDQPAQ